MLTAKQDKFAHSVALEGMTLSDAYRAAYDTSKMTDKTVNEKASVLAAQDKISARITELREQLTSEKIMSAQRRLEWLTEVITDVHEKTENRLKAADIMNKMQGEYVQKIAAEVQTETTINIELVDD